MTEIDPSERKRDLTDKERKKIKDMNLSPRQEDAVRKVWEKERYASDKWYYKPLIILIDLLVIVIMIENLINPSDVTAKFSNVAIVVTWLLIVIIFLTSLILLLSIFGDPLGQLSMASLEKGTIFGKILSIVYILSVTLNGYVVTSFLLLMSILFLWIVQFIVKEKVKTVLDKIEKG